MKPRKSPQEKKRLSLSQDSRKRTGGNVHTARKAYAESKREFSGNHRSKTRQVLKSGPAMDTDKLENRLKETVRESTTPLGKALPLADMIAGKKKARIEYHGARKELRGKREVFRKAMEACMAELKKTAKYRHADEEKVRRVAEHRLHKLRNELFFPDLL